MLNGELDQTLIQALLNPACYAHPVDSVSLKETHISWLLLAGDFVYKIKKPVDFGFLDFTDLGRRHFFCQEELRLNRRLAAGLYLEVIAIGGSTEKPVLGLKPAIEYAVKMQRFAEAQLLDHLLTNDRLEVKHLNRLAATLAQFHYDLPSAGVDSGFGNSDAIALPARQNFQQLSMLLGAAYADRLAKLQAASEQEYLHCLPEFKNRLECGWIKECHGDLHLGNIVLLDEQPTPFDGIEFNADLRWIDVLNDIAFLVMDLHQRQRPDFAFAFLNAYLEISGDYAGLSVMRFYLGYRAMVMAKVSAIRALQVKVELTQCQAYLALAEHFYAPNQPVLIITQGLPGCGKSTLAQIVSEKYQCIRIRSDVERKRLFGLQAHQNSGNGEDIYTESATERTYQHLLDLSRHILRSGFSVIVDAAFLKQAERQQFSGLANQLDVPFAILHIQSDDALHYQRIRQRQIENLDASEADIGVYELLKSARETLTDDERQAAFEVMNNGDIDQLIKNQPLWNALEQGLGLSPHKPCSS
jgi:aminoglycoside phosphotransferase family enzyme/predicted kinase